MSEQRPAVNDGDEGYEIPPRTPLVDLVRGLMLFVHLCGGLMVLMWLQEHFEPVPGSIASWTASRMLEVAPFVLVAWTLVCCIIEFFRSLRAVNEREAQASA